MIVNVIFLLKMDSIFLTIVVKEEDVFEFTLIQYTGDMLCLQKAIKYSKMSLIKRRKH